MSSNFVSGFAGGQDAHPASNNDEYLLELTNVHKHYGNKRILNGINLGVKEHDVVVLIGASGSGKSTMLKAINLLEELSDGQIFLSGEDISSFGVDKAKIRAQIGTVFQQYNLFPHMRVLDNITLAAKYVHNWSKEERENKGIQLLTRIGLADKAREYPERLSGGQQQRVAIARAIITNPKLLLLDEITSALDPMLVSEVLALVADLSAAGSTILMATHEMSFAKQVADRVIFLADGKIVEQGSPQDIFDNPQDERTKAFISKIMH